MSDYGDSLLTIKLFEAYYRARKNKRKEKKGVAS